jgi:hypothetical protein
MQQNLGSVKDERWRETKFHGMQCDSAMISNAAKSFKHFKSICDSFFEVVLDFWASYGYHVRDLRRLSSSTPEAPFSFQETQR